jgi:hypothetical protein
MTSAMRTRVPGVVFSGRASREKSYESIRPARRSKFPARLNKFPVRHELIPSLRNARPKFAVPEAQHTRKAHGGSLEQLALVPRAA